MQLQVFKYEGAGNDFVTLDDRGRDFPLGDEGARLIRALCDRQRGVGADGLLLLQPPDGASADFRMRYFNRDGGEAEMCGNASRCITDFAHRLGVASSGMTFETMAGLYRSKWTPEALSVAFPPIQELPRPVSVEAGGRTWEGSFLVAGVPHLAVAVHDVAEADVASWGRALRFHPEFAPAGTNVNFVQEGSDGVLRLRTYERGVEAETLACGTGAVATAICHAQRKGLRGPVNVQIIPTSGDRLSVDLQIKGDGVDGIALNGPARLVFVTTVHWDPDTGRVSARD